MRFSQQINGHVEFMAGRPQLYVKNSDMPSQVQSTGSEIRTILLSTFPGA